MKNIVITGANRGIGWAFVKAYLKKNDRVFAVCRETNAALDDSGAEIISGVDVAKPESLLQLKKALADVPIDLLINNAGILRDEQFGNIHYDTITEQFLVNAVGPLRVTELLKNNLRKGAKVALITSRMGSIKDNTSGGYYGYRMSKAALNAAGMSLAQDLKTKTIAVAILHPGYVQTDMVNHGGDITADVAAERLMKRIDELTLESSGTFWHSNGEVLPW
jgi:NAD(P)-dependent dehydrogenase (short-subunit alcohol dehydrogenase family)